MPSRRKARIEANAVIACQCIKFYMHLNYIMFDSVLSLDYWLLWYYTKDNIISKYFHILYDIN